jgi:starch-binding outer membrane protein, SusD/RagB family
MNSLGLYHGRRALGSRAPVTLLAFILIFLAGCDQESLLEVNDPVNASPETLENVAGLPTLVAGAIGDFQVGFSGAGGDSYLSVSAVFTDEFYAAGTFTTRIATDQRDQFPTAQGNTSDGAYRNLHRARRALRDAADAVQRLSETQNDPRVSELKALEAYTFVALGEGFCSGIPFSSTERGAPGEFGQPLSTNEVFEGAIGVFDQALGAPSPSPAARIGRARALLNLGRASEAAQAVSGVPTNYVYFVQHSSNSGRQNNPIYSLQQNRRYGVSDSEGSNGLPFRSAGDPRVPWTQNAAGGFDASFPMFDSRRYVSFDTNVPLATGVEARLIEAEALLLAGDPAWLTRLNDLRSQVGPLMTAMFPHWSSVVPGPNNPTTTLEPLADPGTEAGRLDLLYRERGFWLFNTGTRLGDLRRLVRVHGRPSNTVFPTGGFRAGDSDFGDDVAFPVIFDEVNNPNYSISLCDPTQA